MVSEEFSFPKMSSKVLSDVAATPLLWRVSSTVYPGGYYDEAEATAAAAARTDDELSDCEEKMDMLWEDFNEELQRVCSVKGKRVNEAAAVVKSSDEQSAAAAATAGVKKMVEVCCQRESRGKCKTSSKTAVLMIKFLKKLFGSIN